MTSVVASSSNSVVVVVVGGWSSCRTVFAGAASVGLVVPRRIRSSSSSSTRLVRSDTPAQSAFQRQKSVPAFLFPPAACPRNSGSSIASVTNCAHLSFQPDCSNTRWPIAQSTITASSTTARRSIQSLQSASSLYACNSGSGELFHPPSVFTHLLSLMKQRIVLPPSPRRHTASPAATTLSTAAAAVVSIAALVLHYVVFAAHPLILVPVCHAELRFFSSSRTNNNNMKDSNNEKDTTSTLKSSSSNSNGEKSIPETVKQQSGDTGQRRYSSSNSTEPNKQAKGKNPTNTVLKPLDVHYTSDTIKDALSVMRSDKRIEVSQSSAATEILVSAANADHATFTLIGYKGGELREQINQDRAIIVAPYTIHKTLDAASQYQAVPEAEENNNGAAADDEESDNNTNNNNTTALLESFHSMDRILLGVFDGHAPLGEKVSEFTATVLPDLLANKLSNKAKLAAKNTTASATLSGTEIMRLTKDALTETFVELDQTVPADPSGGCTASVILAQGPHIFVANAGDSRSFIVSYRPSTNNVTVVYISREDKPSLPDEKARIEASGGQVYIPARGTSRVVYHDSQTGAPTGLAMSRSIGDWEAGKMGVIPDPIVDVIDIQTLIASILYEDEGDETDEYAYQVDPVGEIVNVSDYSSKRGHYSVGGDNDDIYLFAVSATDGMMDYLQATQIARIMAHSLFDDAGAHPVTAVEHLIFAAANAWQDAKQGRYRDDIAIAVSALRRPPRLDKENTTRTDDKSCVAPPRNVSQ